MPHEPVSVQLAQALGLATQNLVSLRVTGDAGQRLLVVAEYRVPQLLAPTAEDASTDRICAAIRRVEDRLRQTLADGDALAVPSQPAGDFLVGPITRATRALQEGPGTPGAPHCDPAHAMVGIHPPPPAPHPEPPSDRGSRGEPCPETGS